MGSLTMLCLLGVMARVDPKTMWHLLLSAVEDKRLQQTQTRPRPS